jgi:hypothetical protein
MTLSVFPLNVPKKGRSLGLAYLGRRRAVPARAWTAHYIHNLSSLVRSRHRTQTTTPGAVTAEMLNLDTPDRTFLLGELSFAGRFEPVGGVQEKMAAAAQLAEAEGWDYATKKKESGCFWLVSRNSCWLADSHPLPHAYIHADLPPGIGENPEMPLAQPLDPASQHQEDPWHSFYTAFGVCRPGTHVARLEADMAFVSRLPGVEPRNLVLSHQVGVSSSC